MESLIFITEKRNGKVKVRACANESIQCEYVTCNKAVSLTAITEPHTVTSVTDTK
jgi:hypothetical protein